MLDPWSYAERCKSEAANQRALFMWSNMAYRFGLMAANNKSSYTLPNHAANDCLIHNDRVLQLKWLHAIHNQGHGDAIRGANAKAEGVKAGVFDMFLPVPARLSVYNSCYNGLYLELKVGKNKMSSIQTEFADDMTSAGYACECAWGWLNARDKILKYLGLI